MRAIAYHQYGSPDVLQCEEIAKPTPKDNEVLIKVCAASLNPLDWGMLKGKPYTLRLLVGLRKPRDTRPGRDVAGEVEAVGKNVTQFQPGDAVFGLCVANPNEPGVGAWMHCHGSFAEYVCAPESALVAKPENVTFEQAASVPVAALTALQGLRDKGHLRANQKILINGAGGGVGTFTVQIAKAFGAEVTAVTRTNHVELVRSLGADHVVDYMREDFTKTDQRYDVIFDCHAKHPLLACLLVLQAKGIYVQVGGPGSRWMLGLMARPLKAMVLSWFMSQKLVTLLAKPSQADLDTIRELLASGKIRPVIDRSYRLREIPDAVRYLEQGSAHGKVVLLPQ